MINTHHRECGVGLIKLKLVRAIKKLKLTLIVECYHVHCKRHRDILCGFVFM